MASNMGFSSYIEYQVIKNYSLYPQYIESIIYLSRVNCYPTLHVFYAKGLSSQSV